MSHDGHSAPITACAVTPDGATALSASEDRTLKVWDVKTGACRGTLEGNAELVTACAISADGRHALSGARDGSVRLWRLDPQGVEPLEGHADLVSGCAITPDGRILTAARDGVLRIRGPTEPGGPVALKGHDGPVEGCAITPDGTYALSISREGTAKLWDLASRRCERTVRTFEAALLACALTPDGRCAVLGREDGRLEVRDLRGSGSRVLGGHAARVFGCAVSPDGARVISASEDRTLKIWSVETGECLGTLHGTSWFRCVAAAKGLICAGDHDGNLWMVADGTATPPAGGQQPPPAPAPPPVDKTYPLAPLRDALARLYDSKSIARIVARDAGLTMQWIDPSGSPQELWQAILDEASKQRLLRAIARRALQGYNEDPGLLAAMQELCLLE
jgi:WD40 repeat protein